MSRKHQECREDCQKSGSVCQNTISIVHSHTDDGDLLPIDATGPRDIHDQHDGRVQAKQPGPQIKCEKHLARQL